MEEDITPVGRLVLRLTTGFLGDFCLPSSQEKGSQCNPYETQEVFKHTGGLSTSANDDSSATGLSVAESKPANGIPRQDKAQASVTSQGPLGQSLNSLFQRPEGSLPVPWK